MTKEVSKEDFFREKWIAHNKKISDPELHLCLSGDEIEMIEQSLGEFAEIRSIAFAEWIEDNSYTKGKGDKGWYQYFQHVEDLPCGAALSYPVYTFLTIEEIFKLYLQSLKG